MALNDISEEAMAMWRLDRAGIVIRRWAPECSYHRATQAAIRVADSQISPSEFEVLVRGGCDPLVAVDILRPL